jgi:hypothetical protein
VPTLPPADDTTEYNGITRKETEVNGEISKNGKMFASVLWKYNKRILPFNTKCKTTNSAKTISLKKLLFVMKFRSHTCA